MADKFDNNIFDENIFDATAAEGIFDCAIFDSALFDCPSTGPLECALLATETPDTAAFTLLRDMDAALLATEAQDSAAFTAEAQAQTQAVWFADGLPRARPLRARLLATEARDSAQFTAALDHTDDELIMAMMMAAWSADEVAA